MSPQLESIDKQIELHPIEVFRNQITSHNAKKSKYI